MIDVCPSLYLLLHRWRYSPIRTFASVTNFSQSAIFFTSPSTISFCFCYYLYVHSSTICCLVVFLVDWTAVAQWLRCSNRKIALSIPAGVNGFFIDMKKPSDRTMALGSTQPVAEMSTESISCGQRRPVRKSDNLPQSYAVVTKSGKLKFLEPSGTLRVCNGTALPFSLLLKFFK